MTQKEWFRITVYLPKRMENETIGHRRLQLPMDMVIWLCCGNECV